MWTAWCVMRPAVRGRFDGRTRTTSWPNVAPLAMRLAIKRASEEGWLTEHMFIMGVHGPKALYVLVLDEA